MPGPRQPTDLVVANGRKHLSRAEEAQCRSHEVTVERPKTARLPKWLPTQLAKDLRALGKRLIAAGLYTEGKQIALHRISYQRKDMVSILNTIEDSH